MSAQILQDDPNKKPQAKQLQARAEYLLKLLKKEQENADQAKTGEEVLSFLIAEFLIHFIWMCTKGTLGMSAPLTVLFLQGQSEEEEAPGEEGQQGS